MPQSVGSRCGDERDSGAWSCPGSYTTDKCTVRLNDRRRHACIQAGMQTSREAEIVVCGALVVSS